MQRQHLAGLKMTEPVSFDIRMAALRESFAVRARHDGEELRILASLVKTDGAASAQIGVIAHKLAGGAAIFGMPEVSTQAAALEDAILAGASQDDIIGKSLALVDLLQMNEPDQTA